MLDVEAIRREEFPITRDGVYFDHATFGPPPQRHVQAVAEFLSRMSEHGLPDLFAIAQDGLDAVRGKAARFMSCGPDSISFVRSTAAGASLVAEGLDWRPGDEVVAYELDHPAAVLPWLNLASRGVRLRLVRDEGRHGFDPDHVRAALGPRTRAVSLSLVNFGHGTRPDLEAVGAMCRERGLWFVVDAVQALGALRVDVPALGADVVAAHGYKFLLSGFGIGVCHTSERAQRELRLAQIGWKSVEAAFDTERILEFRLDPAAGARRFEPSFPPLPLVFGLGATLDLLLELGPAAVEERVLGLSRRLVNGLRERGYEVVGPQARDTRSAVVSVALGDDQARRFRAACERLRVRCAIRESRVRLSPHFYNSEEEVEALLEEL